MKSLKFNISYIGPIFKEVKLLKNRSFLLSNAYPCKITIVVL